MNELTTEIIAALAQKQDLDEVFVTTSKLRLTSCFKPNWQSFWVTNATHTLGEAARKRLVTGTQDSSR